MIQLTRLNNKTLVLNADLVKFVEQAPDTVITLVNGEKFIVRESMEEVVGRIMKFRCFLMQGIFTSWSAAVAPSSNSDKPAEQAHTQPES